MRRSSNNSKAHSALILISATLLILLTATAISDTDVRLDEISAHQENEYSDVCRDNPVIVEEKVYEDYHIKISRAGDGDCHFIDIEKDSVLLYHNEEIGGHYYFGADLERNANPFMRVTEKDDVNLVFSKWTGGAHCCYSLHVFKLDVEFKEIANIDGGNFMPAFEDVDHDGIPEIKVWDDFLAYLFSCFADSAIGHAVLKYSDDSYRVAAEYMRKPAPDINSLGKKIESWQRILRKHSEPDRLPRSFMQAVTALVFTGNKQTALELVDRTWPADVPGKENFLKSYEEALHESKFYRGFEKQL